jgi:hypothetical protein
VRGSNSSTNALYDRNRGTHKVIEGGLFTSEPRLYFDPSASILFTIDRSTSFWIRGRLADRRVDLDRLHLEQSAELRRIEPPLAALDANQRAAAAVNRAGQ